MRVLFFYTIGSIDLFFYSVYNLYKSYILYKVMILLILKGRLKMENIAIFAASKSAEKFTRRNL